MVMPADAPKALKHQQAYRAMQMAAVQWGAVTGAIGITLHFLGMRFSKFYSGPRMTPAVRLFLVSSTVALGGWAGAEDQHMQFVRIQSEIDDDAFNKKVAKNSSVGNEWS